MLVNKIMKKAVELASSNFSFLCTNAAPIPISFKRPKLLMTKSPMATTPKSSGTSFLARTILIKNESGWVMHVLKVTQAIPLLKLIFIDFCGKDDYPRTVFVFYYSV